MAISATTFIGLFRRHIRPTPASSLQGEIGHPTFNGPGSGQDILSYLQSEVWPKFFKAKEEVSLKPIQPVGRIMTAVQIGVALAAPGAGALVWRGVVSEPNPQESLTVVGSPGIFAGLMLASAARAWFLAGCFGPMNGEAPKET